MTLEEKLKAKTITERLDVVVREVVLLEDAISICKQEIEEACKKQREICARAYLKERGYSETANSIIATVIRNAQSPKEVKE